jgi:hypothetical protein
LAIAKPNRGLGPGALKILKHRSWWRQTFGDFWFSAFENSALDLRRASLAKPSAPDTGVLLTRVGGCQAFTPFGSTRVDDGSARSGGHAGSKSVAAGALESARLKGAFHGQNSFAKIQSKKLRWCAVDKSATKDDKDSVS